MAVLREIPFAESLAGRLAAAPGDGISVYWLGQAGFVIDAMGRRIVIDPYLSDSLAIKYRGHTYPHERMAPAPATPSDLGKVDLVCCTHQHTDHMDGETLSALASRLPALPFVIPAATRTIARERIGIGEERLLTVDAGDRRQFGGLGLHVMRAAHETLETDDDGHHRFLGYGFDFGGTRLFHSGDTIPFDGQTEEVRAFAPDVALLPVNGRSGALKSAGFAGNLTLAEAITLCHACGAGTLIAHHYGMFAFNTLPAEDIDRAAREAPVRLLRARYQIEFRLDGA